MFLFNPICSKSKCPRRTPNTQMSRGQFPSPGGCMRLLVSFNHVSAMCVLLVAGASLLLLPTVSALATPSLTDTASSTSTSVPVPTETQTGIETGTGVEEELVCTSYYQRQAEKEDGVEGKGEEEQEEVRRRRRRRRRRGDEVFDSYLCNLNSYVLGQWNYSQKTYTPKYIIVPPRRLFPSSAVSVPLEGEENRVHELDSSASFHWYTQQETLSCLQNTSVYVIGDSFMKNLFIGLADLIQGNTSDVYYQDLDYLRPDPVLYPEINITSVYRRHFAFWSHADEEIYFQLPILKEADYVIIGILTHDIAKSRITEQFPHLQDREDLDDVSFWRPLYRAHLYRLVQVTKELGVRVLWTSAPSYSTKEWTDIDPHSRIPNQFNVDAFEIMTHHGIPFLDTHFLSTTCTDQSCMGDSGAHKSRYVNRVKAQMVLNHICAHKQNKCG
eukprot:Nk52_evm1s165 gene=Nk52_evmTU1s165